MIGTSGRFKAFNEITHLLLQVPNATLKLIILLLQLPRGSLRVNERVQEGLCFKSMFIS